MLSGKKLKWQAQVWCRKWTLAPWSRAASFLAGCGRLTSCYDFPHSPEPATRLQAFDTEYRARCKGSDQEIWVFSANLWKRIYTSPHRWSLSKTHFLHWYIQGWSEKREGGKRLWVENCREDLFAGTRTRAPSWDKWLDGKRHKHSTAQSNCRKTAHTLKETLSHSLDFTLHCSEVHPVLKDQRTVGIAVLEKRCQHDNIPGVVPCGQWPRDTQSSCHIHPQRLGQVLFSLLKIIGAVKWQELNVRLSWFLNLVILMKAEKYLAGICRQTVGGRRNHGIWIWIKILSAITSQVFLIFPNFPPPLIIHRLMHLIMRITW